MRRIRCAVIGAGWWACEAHIPALLQHPAANLAAIQTRDESNRRRISQHFNVSRTCGSLHEILAIPDLEAAVIASTPNVHFEQAQACLERGLHVLIEKPMTLNAPDARALVALARDRRRHLLVSCPWNFTAHARIAHDLVRAGKLGRLKMISVLMTNFTLGLYKGQSWEDAFATRADIRDSVFCAPQRSSYSDASVAGGGQIFTQVSHVAAYLHRLTQSPVAEVFARFDNGVTPVDVYNAITARLEDGTLLSIASTGATMPAQRTFELRAYGTEGMLHQELWRGEMQFFDAAGKIETFAPLTGAEIYPQYAPAQKLIDLALGGAESGCPGETGLYALELIERARIAAAL